MILFNLIKELEYQKALIATFRSSFLLSINRHFEFPTQTNSIVGQIQLINIQGKNSPPYTQFFLT